jgi:hypothetical protein
MRDKRRLPGHPAAEDLNRLLLEAFSEELITSRLAAAARPCGFPDPGPSHDHTCVFG